MREGIRSAGVKRLGDDRTSSAAAPEKAAQREPLISVIVPVYNVEAYLDRCLRSLVEQTLGDLEIILVDDGSTDTSGDLCDAWAKRDERIVVIHKKNGGLSDARNAGAAQARAPYLGFVDSDDYLAPTMYEVLYESLCKEQADIAVCGVCDKYADHEEIPAEICYSVMTPPEVLSDIFLNKTLMVGVPPRLYPAWLINEVPSPVGKAHEDAFIVVDLFCRVDRIVVDTQPLYFYCHNEGTITSSSYGQASLDSIEAWETNCEKVEKKYPAIVSDVMFRCYWAYFDALDNMVLAAPGRVDPADESRVVSYLRSHYRAIMGHRDVSMQRKVALNALIVGRGCYRALVRLQRRRIHLNG